jgi:hypothetical protein
MKKIFILIFSAMAFTGMGQMPIFKRYYVADIPGMAWSADFYLTHTIHYLGAIFLLCFIMYAAADYLLSGRKIYKLTASGVYRVILLAGIVATGVVRVLKNLPEITFSPNFTMLVDISHLAFMMIFLFSALAFLIFRKGWVKALPRD